METGQWLQLRTTNYKIISLIRKLDVNKAPLKKIVCELNPLNVPSWYLLCSGSLVQEKEQMSSEWKKAILVSINTLTMWSLSLTAERQQHVLDRLCANSLNSNSSNLTWKSTSNPLSYINGYGKNEISRAAPSSLFRLWSLYLTLNWRFGSIWLQ